MSADPLMSSADPDEPVADTARAEQAQRALKEGLAQAERRLTEAARAAERVIREGIEMVRAQTQGYSGPTTMDDAQRYVVERVKERPVTAALAGLGVGFLLGVLLSSRGK